MKKLTITGEIFESCLEFLENSPNGIRWSELIIKLEEKHPGFHPKTINGCVWKLVEKFPDKVCKPEKGLFRLVKFNK